MADFCYTNTEGKSKKIRSSRPAWVTQQTTKIGTMLVMHYPVILAWGGEDRTIRNSASFSLNLELRANQGYPISNEQASK